MTKPVIVFFCGICLLNLVLILAQKSSFTVQLERVATETSNEELISLDLRVECVGRNKFALSGTLNINYNFGDDTMVDVNVYRSMTGNSDYKALPYAIAKKHYLEYINSEYKDYLMPGFKECSDLPQFEDKFEPPLEQKTYVMNECMFSTDWLPENIPDGYYRIELIVSGEVDWKIIVHAKLLRGFA